MSYADTTLIPLLDGLSREVLDGHVLGVIGEVLVQVDIFVVLLGQLEHEVDVLQRRNIVIRNSPTTSAPSPWPGPSFPSSQAASRSLPGEGDHLDINDVTESLAQFQHHIQPRETL